MIIAVVLNSLVSSGMVIRDIETSEHADEVLRVSQAPKSVGGEQVLNLNGYWKKPAVTISFIPQGITQDKLEPIIKNLEETMRVPRDMSTVSAATATATTTTAAAANTAVANATTTFVGWPDLLATLSSTSNVPSLQIIEQRSENADIRVYLKSESHPEYKLGLAKIARNKITYEILYAEVHIYSVQDLRKDDILGQVFKHELGHALGIGHANTESSIMHSPIVIVDNVAIGDIRECEARGTAHLYSFSGGSIGEITCATSPSTAASSPSPSQPAALVQP